MRHSMRMIRTALAILIALPCAKLTLAQQAYEVIPHGVDALRQIASSKTEFSLDHSMLVFAAKLDSDNDDLRRVIAGVSGLSVHRYRFPQPWAYDQDSLRSVQDQYHAQGWKRVVNNHDKDGLPGETELWVRFDHNAITNVAILLARSREVTFVEVAGSISPMDLSHLGGHFGIPKIEGGVEVPASR